MLWRERGEVVASVQGDRRRTVTVAFGRSSGLLGTLPARPFFSFLLFFGPLFVIFGAVFGRFPPIFCARGPCARRVLFHLQCADVAVRASLDAYPAFNARDSPASPQH